MRVAEEEYRGLDLRAHTVLAGVPVHDVWAVDLPRDGPARTVVDLRELLSKRGFLGANPAVRLLFGVRAALGRVLGWDREPPEGSAESFLHRLPAGDRESSLVAPGTREGPFRVLFVSPHEAISEVRNATVHGFSVFALVDRSSSFRLYWAIHVLPVGRITGWYMALIDPFRRAVIYPSVLRHIRSTWLSS